MVRHKTPREVVRLAWSCTGLRMRRHKGRGGGEQEESMPLSIRLGVWGSIISSLGGAPCENEIGRHF